MCIQNTAVGKYGWSIETKIKSSTKILQKSVAKAEPCRTPDLALLYLGSRCSSKVMTSQKFIIRTF